MYEIKIGDTFTAEAGGVWTVEKCAAIGLLDTSYICYCEEYRQHCCFTESEIKKLQLIKVTSSDGDLTAQVLPRNDDDNPFEVVLACTNTPSWAPEAPLVEKVFKHKTLQEAQRYARNAICDYESFVLGDES